MHARSAATGAHIWPGRKEPARRRPRRLYGVLAQSKILSSRLAARHPPAFKMDNWPAHRNQSSRPGSRKAADAPAGYQGRCSRLAAAPGTGLNQYWPPNASLARKLVGYTQGDACAAGPLPQRHGRPSWTGPGSRGGTGPAVRRRLRQLKPADASGTIRRPRQPRPERSNGPQRQGGQLLLQRFPFVHGLISRARRRGYMRPIVSMRILS